MKVVGICGSPRTKGNSGILLEQALEGSRAAGADISRIELDRLSFSPCRACDPAPRDGTCRVRDDMEQVYAAVSKADGIIIASPIYFGSLSAQTKMMIDRFQCRWLARNVFRTLPGGRVRPGAFLCVSAADRADFFENARFIIRHFFKTVDTVYTGELFCAGLEEKGAVLGRPDCLGKASEIGRRIVEGTGGSLNERSHHG